MRTAKYVAASHRVDAALARLEAVGERIDVFASGAERCLTRGDASDTPAAISEMLLVLLRDFRVAHEEFQAAIDECTRMRGPAS